MKYLMAAVWVSLTALLLSGCATTYRDPRSIGLPATKIAILEQPFTMDDFVYISEVNGKSRGTGLFTRFELPPGRNSVLVVGNTHGGMYENPSLLVFIAEAGGVYVMKYDSGPRAHLWKPSSWTGPGTYRAWIENKVTGEKIDEASLQEKAKKTEPIQSTTDNSGAAPRRV